MMMLITYCSMLSVAVQLSDPDCELRAHFNILWAALHLHAVTCDVKVNVKACILNRLCLHLFSTKKIY